MAFATRRIYDLGPFRLDADARVLTYEGGATALGARGASVLAALVSRAGECVRKSDIMRSAWADVVVEEANLAVQISAIRRELGRVPHGGRWIETMARRGYRYIGPVAEGCHRAAVAALEPGNRTNLPSALASFVGRVREVADIRALLPATRLITLTGTGGLGKTRLAQHCAAGALYAYRDGAWFIDLAAVNDPAQVPRAVARVLQVAESPAQSLDDAICRHLRSRQMLLILDNCEHVLSACSGLASTLVREAAEVTVMATSREALRAPGERVYALEPLGVPDPCADVVSITRSDAVQLFVERARQYRPHFDLQDDRARAVADICVRLDGIPLALELAAVRVAVLPVTEIVRLLDQRFRLLVGGDPDSARHRTLRATIDWSYNLLDDAEKALLARLAVFDGGWTLSAAQQVCSGAPIAADDVVYVMIRLIERSLVVVDEEGDRYRLLETIRHYARDKLAETGNARALRQAHRDYYLALVEQAEPELIGAEQAVWLRRLEQETGNLRVALEECLAEVVPDRGLRLCGALHTFWRTRGYLTEGREWCRRMLDKAGNDGLEQERAKALNAAAILAYFQGDYPATRALNLQCLALRKKLGDQKGIAASLINLGNVAIEQSDYPAARALFEESLAIRRRISDRWGIATSLNNLGNVALDECHYSTARTLYQECLDIVRDLGDQRSIAMALNNLASVALQEGDCRGARSLLAECLVIRRELGDARGIAIALCNLGEATCGIGDVGSAQSMLRESLEMLERLGDRRITAACMNNLGGLAYEQREWKVSRAWFARSLEITSALGDSAGVAVALAGLAAGAAALGDPMRAARMWGAATRLRERIGSPVPLKERCRHEHRVAAARADAGDGLAFDQAWREGAGMELAHAIDFALQMAAGHAADAHGADDGAIEGELGSPGSRRRRHRLVAPGP